MINPKWHLFKWSEDDLVKAKLPHWQGFPKAFLGGLTYLDSETVTVLSDDAEEPNPSLSPEYLKCLHEAYPLYAVDPKLPASKLGAATEIEVLELQVEWLETNWPDLDKKHRDAVKKIAERLQDIWRISPEQSEEKHTDVHPPVNDQCWWLK